MAKKSLSFGTVPRIRYLSGFGNAIDAQFNIQARFVVTQARSKVNFR